MNFVLPRLVWRVEIKELPAIFFPRFQLTAIIIQDSTNKAKFGANLTQNVTVNNFVKLQC